MLYQDSLTFRKYHSLSIDSKTVIILSSEREIYWTDWFGIFPQ